MEGACIEKSNQLCRALHLESLINHKNQLKRLNGLTTHITFMGYLQASLETPITFYAAAVTGY